MVGPASLAAVKALLFERKEAKYVAAAVASRFVPGGGASVGPLSLTDVDEPQLPGDDWVRVSPRLTGICGSDLATVEGRSSRYFEPHVSFPFIPGHEVVGELDDGSRVALEPVLGPAARTGKGGGAAPGDAADYAYLLGDVVEPGIQVGYCCSTGGGWGQHLVAHRDQVHTVDEALSDEAAVMIEPIAACVHAALKANVADGASVLVIGAGTMGLGTIAALRAHTNAGAIAAVAKYPHQRELASSLGADHLFAPDEVRRGVRRITGSQMLGDDLAGGVDVTIDAVGSARSLSDAISVTRPRGRVVLVGMPGVTKVDFTPLWHRETELVGAYTYGTETLPDGGTASSFALATDLVASADLGRLVSATYPLDRFVDAIRHAAEAGSRGAVKIAFDQRR